MTRIPSSKLKSFVRTVIVVLSLTTTLFAQLADTRINLNTASAEELARLPGIGPGYAARIIQYRCKHGAFKRPQDIVIIRGFGPKQFRQIAHLVKV